MSYDEIVCALNNLIEKAQALYPNYKIDFNVDINTLQWFLCVAYKPEDKSYIYVNSVHEHNEPVTIKVVEDSVMSLKEYCKDINK